MLKTSVAIVQCHAAALAAEYGEVLHNMGGPRLPSPWKLDHVSAAWVLCIELSCDMRRAIKPGNVGLCGVVSGRILRVAGLSSGDLGNCTGLPPPRRVFPWTALAPAPVRRCAFEYLTITAAMWMRALLAPSVASRRLDTADVSVQLDACTFRVPLHQHSYPELSLGSSIV